MIIDILKILCYIMMWLFGVCLWGCVKSRSLINPFEKKYKKKNR